MCRVKDVSSRTTSERLRATLRKAQSLLAAATEPGRRPEPRQEAIRSACDGVTCWTRHFFAPERYWRLLRNEAVKDDDPDI